MKKLNKILALIMACAMVIGLAACNNSENPGQSTDNGTQAGQTTETTETREYDIVVWVPELAVDLTQKQIDDFNKTNTDGIKINATIEKCSEADAATTMLNDVEAGADIYFFAQDQAARLIQAGALSKLGVKAAETVTKENASGVVVAAKSGDELYAYPLTADNGYFMYYDKSVIPESDIDSLEALIADCEAAGRNFAMETHTSAWYLAGFFFATGCDSEWIMDDGGEFIGVNDTFCSAKGLVAAKGLYKLASSPRHVSSSNADEFKASIPAAVLVSGTWNYNTVLEMLGDNMGVADLPSFTVDGISYHLGSYNGCKLLGVKPQTDVARSAAIHKLAQYLTSEAAQIERFNVLKWGPANTVAQNSGAVQANPALAALLQQAPYSRPQGQIKGTWWDIGAALAANVRDSDGSDEGLMAALEQYKESIGATLNMSVDEASAFTVIGAICGTSWDTDFPMKKSKESGAEYWYSADPMFLNAGEKLQTRQGKGWDVQFGAIGDNGFSTKNDFEVPESGYYYVKLVYDKIAGTGVVSLEKNSRATGWTVIGAIAGTSWDKDFEMEIQADGKTFRSVDKFDLTTSSELKVRYGIDWDLSYGDGGANYKPAADGTYTVVFDSETGAITLEK